MDTPKGRVAQLSALCRRFAASQVKKCADGPVVADGHLAGVDIGALVERQNWLARRLMG